HLPRHPDVVQQLLARPGERPEGMARGSVDGDRALQGLLHVRVLDAVVDPGAPAVEGGGERRVADAVVDAPPPHVDLGRLLPDGREIVGARPESHGDLLLSPRSGAGAPRPEAPCRWGCAAGSAGTAPGEGTCSRRGAPRGTDL